MEGSATGPANFGQLDPAVVNGSGPGPMASVPLGGGPGGVPPVGGGGGAVPGPAAFSMPGQSQPQQPQPQVIQQPVPQMMHNPMPPGVQELNAPVESILLTELQELRNDFKHVRKITVTQGVILFALGVAVIFYLTNSVKAKIEVPA